MVWRESLVFMVVEGIIMDIEFNAFEAFEIAERIERSGAKFYRQAAELFDETRIRNLLSDLAEWEIKHEEIFANMRKQLSEQSRELRTFKPEANLLLDAQAMAGLAVFAVNPEPSREFTGQETKKQVLEKAIQKEKDSIVYYTGLKSFVPARAGQDKIDDIIKEEMHHVRILDQSLQWLNSLEPISKCQPERSEGSDWLK